MVYVCAFHFQKEVIEYFHKVPRRDGSFDEVPRRRPKLIFSAVSSLLSGCPSYYSSTPSSGTKRTCFSFDSKEECLLKSSNLSNPEVRKRREREVHCVGCIQELRDKLYLVHSL